MLASKPSQIGKLQVPWTTLFQKLNREELKKILAPNSGLYIHMHTLYAHNTHKPYTLKKKGGVYCNILHLY